MAGSSLQTSSGCRVEMTCVTCEYRTDLHTVQLQCTVLSQSDSALNGTQCTLA